MDMKLSKTSAQAALAMAFLSERQDGAPTQARQIAEYLQIPTDSALKVLQALARQGLLRSQLGRSGGYHLANEADQISLLQIVEAIDGPIRVDMPISGEGHCFSASVDVLRRVCEASDRQLRDQLSRLTVAQLAAANDAPALLVAS